MPGRLFSTRTVPKEYLLWFPTWIKIEASKKYLFPLFLLFASHTGTRTRGSQTLHPHIHVGWCLPSGSHLPLPHTHCAHSWRTPLCFIFLSSKSKCTPGVRDAETHNLFYLFPSFSLPGSPCSSIMCENNQCVLYSFISPNGEVWLFPLKSHQWHS